MFLSSQCPCLTSWGLGNTHQIFSLCIILTFYAHLFIFPHLYKALINKMWSYHSSTERRVTGCRESGTTHGAREITVPDEDDRYRMTIRTCPTCIWSLRARWMMVRKKSWRRKFDHVMLGLIAPMPKQVDQYDHVGGPPWVKAR